MVAPVETLSLPLLEVENLSKRFGDSAALTSISFSVRERRSSVSSGQTALGKRHSQIKWTRNTPTPSRQWHDLKFEVSGKHVKGYLDNKLYVEHDLRSPVSGKIGVWSKADSVVYFDDYRVVQNAF